MKINSAISAKAKIAFLKNSKDNSNWNSVFYSSWGNSAVTEKSNLHCSGFHDFLEQVRFSQTRNCVIISNSIAVAILSNGFKIIVVLGGVRWCTELSCGTPK